MKYDAEGKVYKDDIGQCWPAGLPLIMTRYWPMAMMQMPTAIYMISGFMNSVRIVYLDGRKHTDPDVDRPHLQRRVDRHVGRQRRWSSTPSASAAITTGWIRTAPPFPPARSCTSSSASAWCNDGKQLEIEYTMTDPDNWEGEWKSTKRFNRVVDVDIQEVSCLPDLNAASAEHDVEDAGVPVDR